MSARLFFRIAALVMFLFAVLHTVGFLSFRPPTSDGMAVWTAMNSVNFTVNGSTYSYGHFYRAFGLSITAAQLFGAWIAWTLGSMAARADRSVRPIAWAFVLWQIAGIVMALMYVSAVPAIMSAVTAILIMIGLFLLPNGTGARQAS